MAEIKMKYKEYYCDFADMKLCEFFYDCLTQDAQDLGCRYFNDGKMGENVIPFGDCVNAKYRYKYKGISVKNYEVEEFEDVYNPHLNCAIVTTRSAIYDNCVKVEIDGECIYNSESED